MAMYNCNYMNFKASSSASHGNNITPQSRTFHCLQRAIGKKKIYIDFQRKMDLGGSGAWTCMLTL
jgi:hypothetical protein